MQNSEKNGDLEGRRTRYDIVADILRIAKVPARKTQIVYEANSNFAVVKSYLSGMMAKGLIREKVGNPSRYYEATDKGLRYLELYKELTGCFD